MVLRGTRTGPSTAPRLLSRDSPGVGGLPYGDDGLGMSLASGDFDGHGYADLAAGIPGDRAVYVFRGSARGLTGRGLRQLELGNDEPDLEVLTPIGSVLVAGDVDRDGFDDLVVGPRPLRIHRGAARGLARRPYRTLAAPKGTRPGFGSALAVADVDGDRDLDLVEGAAGFPLGLDDPPTPGHLTYCPGTRTGPIACRRFLGGRPGPASLAIADVTGDGYRSSVTGAQPPQDRRDRNGRFHSSVFVGRALARLFDWPSISRVARTSASHTVEHCGVNRSASAALDDKR